MPTQRADIPYLFQTVLLHIQCYNAIESKSYLLETYYDNGIIDIPNIARFPTFSKYLCRPPRTPLLVLSRLPQIVFFGAFPRPKHRALDRAFCCSYKICGVYIYIIIYINIYIHIFQNNLYIHMHDAMQYIMT